MMPHNALKFILPQWPAPVKIKAISTTRTGGYSQPPYASFNLALHVGDDPANVRSNRSLLAHHLPGQPVWLNQIHSHRVLEAVAAANGADADGIYTTRSDTVCVVMTADCLPVLICNRQGTGVAALHAGWRGLADGIIEQGISQLMKLTQSKPDELLVWLGPAIGPEVFEVGEDVRQRFMGQSLLLRDSFRPAREAGKWLADVYQLARLRLSQSGVENVYGGDYCTYTQAGRFFSYRRDGKTGRMASLIWIDSDNEY